MICHLLTVYREGAMRKKDMKKVTKDGRPGQTLRKYRGRTKAGTPGLFPPLRIPVPPDDDTPGEEVTPGCQGRKDKQTDDTDVMT